MDDLKMRVVHERLEVRAREPVRRVRKGLEVDRGSERDLASERFEDLR